MYFCYIDESGTPLIPGNTSHYVLAGISIPIRYWKLCDKHIFKIKQKYGLENSEIHAGWIMRKYLEQSKIAGFDVLNYSQRRHEVEKIRNTELLRLQKSHNHKLYKQTLKNYKQTKDYIHLTLSERIKFIQEISDDFGKWTFARICAECIDKIHFDPSRMNQSIDEQAFEQVISRFEKYLQIVSKSTNDKELYGALIHDNNETVSRKLTNLMKQFLYHGTLWTRIDKIIETPLFVNSELTGLVQIADLCSYSLRRFFENGETDLIDRIKSRFDRKDNKYVGVRHFTNSSCPCFICKHIC